MTCGRIMILEDLVFSSLAFFQPMTGFRIIIVQWGTIAIPNIFGTFGWLHESSTFTLVLPRSFKLGWSFQVWSSESTSKPQSINERSSSFHGIYMHLGTRTNGEFRLLSCIVKGHPKVTQPEDAIPNRKAPDPSPISAPLAFRNLSPNLTFSDIHPAPPCNSMIWYS